jgi:hypothetical protein
MSWRAICQIQGASKHSIPVWLSTAAHRTLAVDARRRIFGGAPLAGMSEDGLAVKLGKKNRRLLSKEDSKAKLNQLQWPFIRPEIMSGRAYREREKLQAKVQAGIKGIAAGLAEAAKEAASKKKK